MKGNKKVLSSLSKLLIGELTSIHQYFLHSEMLFNWGLDKVGRRFKHEMQEETEHARLIIQRMLFLETTPDLSKMDEIFVGKDIQEIYSSNLKYELSVRDSLKETISICEAQQDFETRRILEGLLNDTEEDHIYWLEQQLELIPKVGIFNYLQSLT